MLQQQLIVPNLRTALEGKSIAAVSEILDTQKKQTLNYVPWREYPYKPQVNFAIAHSGDCIFLKFFVNEKYLRAVNTDINSPVYEDSCVEFFISFDNKGYYNFECNSLGTFLLYFGKDRNMRQPLPKEAIRAIQTFSTIEKSTEDNIVSWTITWKIPIMTFIHHPDLQLGGHTYSANFYKCGDKTSEPHYVAWSNIGTAKPDFHTPQYFGELRFE